MKEEIAKFLRYLSTERGASAHTIRSYRKDLEVFSEQIHSDVESVDFMDVRGFVAAQMGKGLKKSTVGRRLATVRSFFRFMHREGIIKTNPARLVNTPKMPKLLPKFLTVDDVFSLIE